MRESSPAVLFWPRYLTLACTLHSLSLIAAGLMLSLKVLLALWRLGPLGWSGANTGANKTVFGHLIQSHKNPIVIKYSSEPGLSQS